MDGKKTRGSGAKRESPISFRPRKGTREEFLRRVEKSGKSANAYLNDLVFFRGSRIAPAQAALGLRYLAAIKEDLRKARPGEHNARANEFEALRQLLLMALGKR